MLFPIGDDNSDRLTTPYVNYLLIALNILVFVLFQGVGSNDQFTYAWATVPQEIVTGVDIARRIPLGIDPSTGRQVGILLQPIPLPVYTTLLTSMFMHGGLMHLLGNMLYLWIFGDNLEDRLGHIRYAVFYLLCGVVASLAHVLMNADSYIPSLGASGAISGVLGGYILLYPRRRVKAIVLRGFLTEVPAFVAIGIWFLFQLFESYVNRGASGGGVAYAAHIGGFVAGLLLIKFFAIGRGGAGAAGGPVLRGY
ncbi:MAG TPA: rhomboid family intramembrane serine protease [Pyrinomonadaceae bacterium]|nr:rhomboid family intramembrane serine protease [Pyrinomonadaceae bacterium]